MQAYSSNVTFEVASVRVNRRQRSKFGVFLNKYGIKLKLTNFHTSLYTITAL